VLGHAQQVKHVVQCKPLDCSGSCGDIIQLSNLFRSRSPLRVWVHASEHQVHCFLREDWDLLYLLTPRSVLDVLVTHLKKSLVGHYYLVLAVCLSPKGIVLHVKCIHNDSGGKDVCRCSVITRILHLSLGG